MGNLPTPFQARSWTGRETSSTDASQRLMSALQGFRCPARVFLPTLAGVFLARAGGEAQVSDAVAIWRRAAWPFHSSPAGCYMRPPRADGGFWWNRHFRRCRASLRRSLQQQATLPRPHYGGRQPALVARPCNPVNFLVVMVKEDLKSAAVQRTFDRRRSAHPGGQSLWLSDRCRHEDSVVQAGDSALEAAAVRLLVSRRIRNRRMPLRRWRIYPRRMWVAAGSVICWL